MCIFLRSGSSPFAVAFVFPLRRKADFVEWYAKGGPNQVEKADTAGEQADNVPRLSRAELESAFQVVDKNGDMVLDVCELAELEKMLELGWEEGKCGEVFNRLDVEKTGSLSFEQLYAW